jgi:hypothetical protein
MRLRRVSPRDAAVKPADYQRAQERIGEAQSQAGEGPRPGSGLIAPVNASEDLDEEVSVALGVKGHDAREPQGYASDDAERQCQRQQVHAVLRFCLLLRFAHGHSPRSQGSTVACPYQQAMWPP